MKWNEFSYVACVCVIVVRFVAKKNNIVWCVDWLPSLPSLVYQFTGFQSKQSLASHLCVINLFICSIVCVRFYVPASTNLYVCARTIALFSYHLTKWRVIDDKRKKNWISRLCRSIACVRIWVRVLVASVVEMYLYINEARWRSTYQY